MFNEDTMIAPATAIASRSTTRQRSLKVVIAALILGGASTGFLWKGSPVKAAPDGHASSATATPEALERLEAACSQPQFPETIRDFCLQHGEYARQLPDCTKACQRLVGRTSSKTIPWF